MHGFLQLRVLIFLPAILLACCTLAAPARWTQTLPAIWRIQPAVSPDTDPKADEWGTIASLDWRSGGIQAKGTSWEKVKRPDVNSLWYEQTVTIPAEQQGQRVVVDFRRIEGDAIVFLNGQRVAELLRPGGEVDVTARVAWGVENTLRVFMTRDYTGISRGYTDDPLRYLSRGDAIPMARWGFGITAPVTVLTRPRLVAITDVFAVPSWRNKELTLEVELEADAPGEGYELQGTVLDADGKTALTLTSPALTLPAGRSVQRVTAKWANPITWELDRGYLYTAQVTLLRGTEPCDTAPAITFGFREIWSEGRKLMMNGHPSHWRLATVLGLNVNSLDFHRLIGYNVVQIQPNPTAWWRDWAETPMLDAQVLAAMNAKGVGVTVPVPGWNSLRAQLLTDERVRADYDREMAHIIKRYRNNPAILAWTVGMNSYNPTANIYAGTLGRRIKEPLPVQAQSIVAACEFVKRYDATRPAFSHADGSVGDISSANVYLNFIPLQEREEWPMAWAESGDMPYSAVEFGQPYTANFWKGKRFLMTEYLAMYFGDRAYQTEGEAGLRRTVEYGEMNKGHGAMGSVDLAQYPEYWEFQRLFVRNTNRAWRTWGVNAGWLYWVLDTGYGDPPGFSGRIFGRYDFLREPVTEKPAWVSPNFEIHRQANQPLLVYIAGAPRHTDKTHMYYAGETITKQIAAIWDGVGRRSLRAEWALTDGTGRAVKSGKSALSLDTGRITFMPITIAAPAVVGRADYRLTLNVFDRQEVVATDEFPLTIFARVAPLKLGTRFAIFDPQGKSGSWVKVLGVNVVPWKPGDALDTVSVLIIGREALQSGDALPYTAQDIARGLRVMILEQQPDIWEGLGLRAIETMPRYVFPRDTGSPVLAGLQPDDLINWRGTPDLFPEGKAPRTHDVRHAPKWTNTHAVASVALRIPSATGFTPVLAAEFDLSYSPLLEWRYGKGAVYACSLDLTGRVGVDPAATLLARNLLNVLATAPARGRIVRYAGDAAGAELLARAHVGFTPDAALDTPENMLLVIGQGANLPPAELSAFVARGGLVLTLPQTAETLAAAGFTVETKSLVRGGVAPHPYFRAIGPSLLRWRDPLEVIAFTPEGQPAGCTVYGNGIFLVRTQGKGAWIHLQVSPALLANRYADNPDKRSGIELSVERLHQLMAQLLTNLGATPSDALAKRFTTIKAGPSYETLGHWQVLGPFPVAKDDGELMINTEFAGEADAIAGDTNPNTIYTLADGKRLDWRGTVTAKANRYIDLGKALGGGELAVAYVTRTVHSDTTRTARLRLGMDYRMKVWVNGEPIFKLTTGHGAPSENRHQVDIPMRAGENIITIKVGSGSKGFGFWANLSKPGVDVTATADQMVKDASLYGPEPPKFDPYEYFYW